MGLFEGTRPGSGSLPCLPTWPSCPAMVSWRHHERIRPGPAAAPRHGRGLGLTELTRRLTLRCAGRPAPAAAVPLGARLSTPPSSTRPGRAWSPRGEPTAQETMAAEARSLDRRLDPAPGRPPSRPAFQEAPPVSPPSRRAGYVTSARRRFGVGASPGRQSRPARCCRV